MTETAEPFVDVRDLSISYRTTPGGPAVHVVHDVSLQVVRGQTLAVVGESGSGKLTVARTLLDTCVRDHSFAVAQCRWAVGMSSA